MIDRNKLHHRRPEVDDAREFLEITRDFTDPRDAIREGISNSIDWGATEIKVTITEDDTRPDEELVRIPFSHFFFCFILTETVLFYQFSKQTTYTYIINL
jgi:hypothetical protein